MLERRESRRVDLNTLVPLTIEGGPVNSQLVNFSNEGALFRIRKPDAQRISTMDLGKEATFVLRLKTSPDREYTGEIIRFFFKGQDKFIALRFWKKYRELPKQ
jgi:hypothetical protein